ncbi:MAG: deoxycytidylate deaminase [Candidatus Saccharibacteria bacterium]|nr:deoxycytidylate deaminase [Candidatus Saccharibacteria bacterium]
MTEYYFDWSDLVFGSKKPLRSLHATLIATPRQLSGERFTQLIKAYLPHGHVIVGIAKHGYIDGFEDQPQFKTLQLSSIRAAIDKINTHSPHKVYVLEYSQRDNSVIFEKLNPKRVVLVNGSWASSFHLRPEFYTLVSNDILFDFVSPFASEQEAKTYETSLRAKLTYHLPEGHLSNIEVMEASARVARSSYDTSFQTGAVLAKPSGKSFSVELAAHNIVIPYETFALHHGASRERHRSPAGDQNHYDTVHAEAALIIRAAENNISLKNKTLFVNLLPCPTCARNLALTDISEVVYSHDHSDGYAVALLEAAGKTVRRITSLESTI